MFTATSAAATAAKATRALVGFVVLARAARPVCLFDRLGLAGDLGLVGRVGAAFCRLRPTGSSGANGSPRCNVVRDNPVGDNRIDVHVDVVADCPFWLNKIVVRVPSAHGRRRIAVLFMLRVERSEVVVGGGTTGFGRTLWRDRFW